MALMAFVFSNSIRHCQCKKEHNPPMEKYACFGIITLENCLKDEVRKLWLIKRNHSPLRQW
jgi:hypothetical protein